MAIRAEAARQKLVEQVGATERMVEDQEAEKQFHQAKEADKAAKQSEGTEEEAKLTDPPPEVSIARLETKLDGLEQQKNKPTPHLISTQQIATQEETASTATSAGLSDQAPVTADSLEEHALKRLHVGLENSVCFN